MHLIFLFKLDTWYFSGKTMNYWKVLAWITGVHSGNSWKMRCAWVAYIKWRINKYPICWKYLFLRADLHPKVCIMDIGVDAPFQRSFGLWLGLLNWHWTRIFLKLISLARKDRIAEASSLLADPWWRCYFSPCFLAIFQVSMFTLLSFC